MGRILVIDDEEAIRDLLQRALSSAGHEVVLAKDGSEGLRKCIQKPPDLVLIDLYMPDCDGMELISDLRKRFPKLPIFAMSGKHLADHLLRMVKLLGVKETFRKPFVIAEVLVAIYGNMVQEQACHRPSRSVGQVRRTTSTFFLLEALQRQLLFLLECSDDIN